MTKIHYALGAVLLLASGKEAAAIETPLFYAGQFTVQKSVSNVPIAIPSKIYLSADVGLKIPTIYVEAVADLGDLQQKIPQIIAGANLPHDNCRSYSANNPVVSLSNTRLTFSGGAALFYTEGSVAIWDCRQNLVPNSKLVWGMVKIGPLKTKLKPHLITWPGNPIKNKIATQPFTIEIPVTLQAVSGSTLAVQLGQAHANLGGQYSGITKELLSLLNVDISQKLNAALSNAMDPKLLAGQLPNEITGAGIVLNSAKFVSLDSGATLGAKAQANLKLTTTNARAIGYLLYQALKKKVVGQK